MNVRNMVILQIAALFFQGLNALTFPEKYRLFVGVLVMLGQAISAVLALYRNPDGTPAAQPYKKDDEAK